MKWSKLDNKFEICDDTIPLTKSQEEIEVLAHPLETTSLSVGHNINREKIKVMIVERPGYLTTNPSNIANYEVVQSYIHPRRDNQKTPCSHKIYCRETGSELERQTNNQNDQGSTNEIILCFQFFRTEQRHGPSR